MARYESVVRPRIACATCGTEPSVALCPVDRSDVSNDSGGYPEPLVTTPASPRQHCTSGVDGDVEGVEAAVSAAPVTIDGTSRVARISVVLSPREHATRTFGHLGTVLGGRVS